MNVLVFGGREYADQLAVMRALDKINQNSPITWLITGSAKGADLFGERWAKSRGVNYAGIPAKWKLHGKAAGPFRNQEMMELPIPVEAAVGFPGGRGTADMATKLEAAGIKIWWPAGKK